MICLISYWKYERAERDYTRVGDQHDAVVAVVGEDLLDRSAHLLPFEHRRGDAEADRQNLNGNDPRFTLLVRMRLCECREKWNVGVETDADAVEEKHR